MITTASVMLLPRHHRDLEDWPGKRPGEFINMGYIHVSEDYFNALDMTMKGRRNSPVIQIR